MRVRRPLLPLLGLAVLLLPGGGAADGGDDGFRDTGERFRYAPTGAEYRVLRDDASGRKVLEGPDGARRESVEKAVLAEEARLTPLRRAIHPALWSAVEDPARAGETLRVVLVLRGSPVHDAAVAARDRSAPAVEARLARLREILGGIGPLRAEDPDRALQVGHRMEEEAALLSAAEREESRALRREVQDLLRGMRSGILAEARPRVLEALGPVEAAVLGVPGARLLGRSILLNGISAEVPAGAVAGLLDALPQVGRVLPHGIRTADLNTSVATIGASSWIGAGSNGSGTKVAVLDTGIDVAHPGITPPGLPSVVTAQGVFLSAGSTDPGFTDNASSTDDIFGHGTHVAGIVAGQDSTYRGVAPGAAVLNAKCGYRSSEGGSLQDADIMAAGDWAADQGADAFNGSFGSFETTDGSAALTHFFDAAADDLGISVAIAAGNKYINPNPSLSLVNVTVPGDGFNVVTVGAFNDAGTTTHSDNSISSFSCVGPLDDGRRKPDLAAPGSQISSANPAWEGAAADYVAWDGTSMATPHVAGAMALLLDYAASWRPEGVKALLAGTTRNTSPYPTTPDDTWGTGGLDLAAAFTSRASVVEGTLTSSGARAVFVRSGSLASGRRATLCWNREVVANGSGAPTTYRAPADLDLYVYEESDDTARGSSTASLDTVEQAKVSSSTTFPILKIHRFGSFPSGQAAVRWAVATEATTASRIVTPPALSTAYTSLPAAVRGDQEFTVAVTVTNNGELPATTPAISLSLRSGYALVSGDNPQTTTTIPAVGDSRSASWTVRAPSSGNGTKYLSAFAATTSFGEDFAAPAAVGTQVLDTGAPSCFVSVENGRTAAPASAVSVGVIGFDNLTGISVMRLRNGGGSWGPWQAYATSVAWVLDPPGEGARTVEAQVRDGVGNESAVASDTILVDATAPTGSFVLQGGAAYAMPWEGLSADTISDDGAGGSGVAAFLHRWDGGPWSAGAALLGGDSAALDRPASEGLVRTEGRFEDAAGNLSPVSSDGIYLVEAAPTPLTAVRSWRGTLDPGGDVDAFRIGLLPGDLLSVRVKARPLLKGADVRALVDVYDPTGVRLATGRFPGSASKPGIANLQAALPGEYWIVLYPSGEEATVGAGCTLSVKVRRQAENLGAAGTAEPAGGAVIVDLQAPDGATLAGRLSGAVAGDPEVLGPDNRTLSVPTVLAGRGLKVPGTVLAGGTGLYLLRIPASGPVTWTLSVRPAKGGKAVEDPE